MQKVINKGSKVSNIGTPTNEARVVLTTMAMQSAVQREINTKNDLLFLSPTQLDILSHSKAKCDTKLGVEGSFESFMLFT